LPEPSPSARCADREVPRWRAAATAAQSKILDQWCAEVGRDPATIERTVAIDGSEVPNAAASLDAGATHLIVMVPAPFDLAPVQQLLETAHA
jgi:hypothetical protein